MTAISVGSRMTLGNVSEPAEAGSAPDLAHYSKNKLDCTRFMPFKGHARCDQSILTFWQSFLYRELQRLVRMPPSDADFLDHELLTSKFSHHTSSADTLVRLSSINGYRNGKLSWNFTLNLYRTNVRFKTHLRQSGGPNPTSSRTKSGNENMRDCL